MWWLEFLKINSVQRANSLSLTPIPPPATRTPQSISSFFGSRNFAAAVLKITLLHALLCSSIPNTKILRKDGATDKNNLNIDIRCSAYFTFFLSYQRRTPYDPQKWLLSVLLLSYFGQKMKVFLYLFFEQKSNCSFPSDEIVHWKKQ